MSEPVRIGVVGTGALGRHHVRILSGLDGAELVGVYDIDRAVGEGVARSHGTRAYPDLASLAAEIEAAVVAVPTVDHAEVGCELLARRVSVLVEKPIAPRLEEADLLLAAAGDRVLAVGHVEFFNPALAPLFGLGQPGFLEVDRLAGFKPRSLDIDVVLDLMIHDLQILHALDPSPVEEIRAKGVNVLTPRVDIANVRIALESGCVANLTASRVSAEPVRKLRVFLPDRGYYSLDFLEQEIKGFRLEEEGPERRLVPHEIEVGKADALERELAGFVAACRGDGNRIVAGAEARRALKTALRVAAEIAASG